MSADHIAWTLAPGFDTRFWVLLLHAVGRIAAPCMFFFVAEGFYHTKSLKKYALRLAALAVVSHFAYCFCFDIPFASLRTSVIWGLLCGLMLLCVNNKDSLSQGKKSLLIIILCILSIPSDWSVAGAAAILFTGIGRGDFGKQMRYLALCMAAYCAVFFFCIDRTYGLIQLFSLLALPLLSLYNGERGECRKLGRFFYVYYPAHLALLGLLRVLLKA